MNFRIDKSSVAVIGDVMIDAYIWGDCQRVSPEAPVAVVDSKSRSYRLGGAGNVVSNLIALDCEVTLFSVIGDDENAKILESLLESKVSKYLIKEKGRITTKKMRIMASKQQVLRVDDEVKRDILQESIEKILKDLDANIDKFDLILLSDYAKGVVTDELSKRVIELANKKNIPILIDPKGSNYSKYEGATLLTPNKKEASIATKIDIIDSDSAYRATKWLKDNLGLKYGVLTLSESGIAILDNNFKIVPTVAKEVYDVTGAGDTVLAALGVAIANGASLEEAAEFANSAAAVVVAKVGSATATIDEILDYNSRLKRVDIEDKIVTKSDAKEIVKEYKKSGKKIVFTNGCFDILHKGHAYYLNEAKKAGDILIVGLNSDGSVKRLKGESRPINSEDDRAYLLSALSSVDFVVIFDEDTPYDLIESIKPNILVKGADYRGKEVVGANLVDELMLIDFVEGRSTTNIVKKIAKG